ncbi:MAG: DUF362 domain-containing protein [Caldithrix sp.]|nr:DUF362 domain-containing protein [Caldithrix sp.]
MAKNLTRRDFLKHTGQASIAGALYLSNPGIIYGNQSKKSRVVLIRHKDVLDDNGQPRKAILADMLDEAVSTLLQESDIQKAWQQIIKPDDVVGIKTNVWHLLPTPPMLNDLLTERVQQSGVTENQIGVKDRGLLSDAIFKKASALINVRPMRTHDWSGVGSLIKNYIMFVEKPYAYHDDSCADLASIWHLPHVKGKTRLNILVMLTPLFHGVGPHHFNPKYVWQYDGLLVGMDPVAVDAMGVRILQAKRKAYFGEDRPINPPPKHIRMADERHHLGTADPAKIDLIYRGWAEDRYI